ncbi:DUF4139 domain-containing protein [Phenylobacterium montanum]|uniref:DUF4139 domain-containing protein n=1 Tax=Phenylobacterium montanum TaxID=2823693 RepID=A0A975FZ20_9CAUL|nr:DUF4139 domain-containing protein [Caulobacter sp. S6]QUD87477.1 DUF4139 domain-containing protein [Caulobacter sp. S6]
MGKTALLTASAMALAHAALAADAPKLSVTIYNADQALVQDQRLLDIAKGRQRLEFKDVSAAIRPETVTLSADAIGVVEQNFDYDLLTPGKLMEKAVGHEVTIVRTNPGNGQQVTEKATVLSANEGVVLKIGDRIEVLRDDDVPTRVIFDKVPDNLRAHPTLSVTVDSERAGQRLATLSYLTTGLSWKADYVALFDEKAAKLDLQGWITLENHSGAPYVGAETQLVAGHVQLAQGDDASDQSDGLAAVRAAGTEADEGPGKELGDYHIYSLPERTTIAQNQTKQVGFLQADGVAAHKVYQWSAGWFQTQQQPSAAVVVVDFVNSRGSGLAAGLPAGTMRVYERDTAGEPKFVGESQIGHTPQGSELAVKIGDAFDVTVQPTVTAETKISKTRTRYSMTYVARNARREPVTVELRQGGLWRDGKVLKESLQSRRIDAHTLGWSIPVPANGQTTLTFDVETGW